MKLKCPACGAPIAANDINIRELVAVCPDCHNVFNFAATFQLRRKFKPPAQFRMADDDPRVLDMSFKWSWRTEPPASMAAVVLYFVVSLGIFASMLLGGGSLTTILLPLIPLVLTGYTLLAILVNSTHYQSDGEMFKVFTTPLPYLRYGRQTIALGDITDVTIERPAYAPFPEGKAGFFNVYVHTLNEGNVRIAAYVNFEHAHFIQQEVQNYLQTLRTDALQSDAATGSADAASEPRLDDVEIGSDGEMVQPASQVMKAQV